MDSHEITDRRRRGVEALRELRRRAARAKLSEFTRQAWPIIEPGLPIVWNWHLDVLCEELEAQESRDESKRRTLILVPPGTMKSILVSVMLPAWAWIHDPTRRKRFLSNDEDVVLRDARRVRDIIRSDWYRTLLREPWSLRSDRDAAGDFSTTAGGFRCSQSINSRITGKRSDDIVIDDPIDAKSVVNGSATMIRRRMKYVANVVGKTLPTRVNRLSDARWTVIMQRLHEEDIAGVFLKEGGWNVVQFQMEFDPDNPMNHPNDVRKHRGELLFPELFPSAELERLKGDQSLSARHYSAQYQQVPRPEQGGYMQRSWFADDTRYDVMPPCNMYLAGDFAVTEASDGTEPDFTDLGAFGYGADEHVYVADWWHGQTSSAEWIEALVEMMKRHKPLAFFGEAGVIRNSIEPFLLQRMRQERVWCELVWLPSFVDKAARGRPFQAMAARKQVHFPLHSTWATRVIEQCINFPDLFDDAFDTMGNMCRAIAEAHPAIVRSAPPTDETRDYDDMATVERSGSWQTR
jgi:predicted phage terminase large subunit-like protein